MTCPESEMLHFAFSDNQAVKSECMSEIVKLATLDLSFSSAFYNLILKSMTKSCQLGRF